MLTQKRRGSARFGRQLIHRHRIPALAEKIEQLEVETDANRRKLQVLLVTLTLAASIGSFQEHYNGR